MGHLSQAHVNASDVELQTTAGGAHIQTLSRAPQDNNTITGLLFALEATRPMRKTSARTPSTTSRIEWAGLRHVHTRGGK